MDGRSAADSTARAIGALVLGLVAGLAAFLAGLGVSTALALLLVLGLPPLLIAGIYRVRGNRLVVLSAIGIAAASATVFVGLSGFST